MSLVLAEVKGAVTATDKQLAVLESRVEELNLSSDDEQEAGPQEGKAEVLQQLEEERKALEASRTLLDELLLKAQEEALAKVAAKSQDSSTTVSNVTFGNQNSGQQAGVINGGVHGAVFGGR
jgi:TolA-binding protein